LRQAFCRAQALHIEHRDIRADHTEAVAEGAGQCAELPQAVDAHVSFLPVTSRSAYWL
jgi:hypothetical protein